MYSPVLSVPARRVSGWVAETDPRYARAWLEALPLANSTESAREIYQALYTINRVELKVQARLELMALYEPAVATVCAGLHSYLAHASPPLTEKKRQLAEFIRRLHVEMAYGYKCSLRDLSRARLLLGKKPRFVRCIERALFHLGEVLRRSYVVYIPCPPGVWHELHELYRLAESLGVIDESVADEAASSVQLLTIAERYMQALLLGLVNPYHLPHSGAQQVNAFLAKWGKQARISKTVTAASGGQFLIDLGADTPPVPLAVDVPLGGDTVRLLDVQALVRTLQGFSQRLEAGEAIEALDLGMDALDSACIDLLRRMRRAWSSSVRRRYARQQSSSNVFACAGLQALHYFSNGQRPFAIHALRMPRTTTTTVDSEEAPSVAFVELEEADAAPDTAAATIFPPTERHQVDRWKLRDVGPQGMSLERHSDVGTALRVGDLMGVQQPSDMGRWRASVIRWIKSPESNSVQVGVEVLAPSVMPVAMRLHTTASSKLSPQWFPGLRLPAVELARRPSTILLARGVCRVGDELELIEEEGESRPVRVLRLLERTGSFEQIVYADIVRS